jgi:2-polyprenyl-6-hydroxyphenyl methylase/3-demethylubiquinone-9 3-methyltransferase
MTAQKDNVDPREVEKFAAAADRWWDPEGESGPLHRMNPVRLDYIRRQVGGLSGKQALDVGCGGGLLSEAMAADGATVTGLDMSDEVLAVARLHLAESGLSVDYIKQSVESLADERPAAFDVVTCMEMLEHVPDPSAIVTACTTLVRPGGHVIFSTINRRPLAYLKAILGAEYLPRLLPPGTHDYSRFIRPSELAGWAREAGLVARDVTGLEYNPLTRSFRIGGPPSVNYLASFARPSHSH